MPCSPFPGLRQSSERLADDMGVIRTDEKSRPGSDRSAPRCSLLLHAQLDAGANGHGKAAQPTGGYQQGGDLLDGATHVGRCFCRGMGCLNASYRASGPAPFGSGSAAPAMPRGLHAIAQRPTAVSNKVTPAEALDATFFIAINDFRIGAKALFDLIFRRRAAARAAARPAQACRRTGRSDCGLAPRLPCASAPKPGPWGGCRCRTGCGPLRRTPSAPLRRR